MYDIILLDLDHTIFDFHTSEEGCIQKIFETIQVPYQAAYLEAYRTLNKSLWKRLEKGELTKEELLDLRFNQYFKDLGIECDGAYAESIFRNHLNHSAEIFPEALEVLKALKARGKKIYSASNGVFETQMKRLEKAGLMHFFDGHFISEQVEFEKPSIQFFEYCLKHVGDAPLENILMVGDSLSSDIQGAVNAGIDACWFNANHDPVSPLPKYEIHDLRDLLTLV